MKNKRLEVKVSSRKTNGSEFWEGTVSIPGTKPTKLVRAASGTSMFSTRSAVISSANSLAKKLGYTGSTASAQAAKKTAKKATKSVKRARATPSTATSSTSTQS